MASKRKRPQIDPLVVIEELARLIEQQSLLALQASGLTQVQKELFRVRGKRVETLLALVKACEKTASPHAVLN